MVLIEDVDEEQENEAQAAQWRRIQVVEEDSDDADGAAQPSLRVWSDPCPDLEISCSVAGAEDAKSRGNRLFGDGKLAECERWFTKALWLYESGKVQDFPGDLRCALQTNRALCRLKLQRFQDAEQDCSAALEEKPTNGKARYRRALARFEQGKLIPGLQDAARAVQDLPADSRDEAQQLKTRIEEHLKAGTGGGGQLGGNESNASKENSYRKIPIREVDKAAVPASAKSPAPAPKPAASAPAPGFKRMEIVEASDSEEEQADSAKAPTPTPAKPASAKSPAPAPKPAASAPAPGFKRMEIVEASDSEDEEPRKPSEPKPAMAEVNGLNEYGSQEELHPDIQVEPTMAGAEKAKQRANELFQKGQLDESVRWFSKAIWLLESGKIAGANGTFRSVLYSNRAFARSKMQQWALVEEDANQALSSNEKNAKALYRRAHARLELKKLDAALQDVDLLIPMLASPSDKEALELKQRILEQKAQSELFTRKEMEVAAHAQQAAVPASAKSPAPAPKPAASAPAPGFKRMEIVEASDSEEEQADSAKAPSLTPAKPASAKSPAPAPKPAASAPAPGFKRMEIVEASDSEEEQADSAKAPTPTPAKPASAKSPAPAPKPAASAAAPGFKRMEIVEASDSEDEEPRKPSEPKPAMAEVNGLNEHGSQEELHPDIQVEPTMAGAEKAKQRANELFQKGQLDESVRWFSKAIWLLESGKIAGANGTFRSVLYSNRAFARSKMQQWALVEEDANQALSSNEKNAKALYRRAHARLELKKLDAALQDVDLLIPMLASPSDKEALELKQRILEQKAQSELFTREEVEAAKDAGSKLFSQQDLHGAVEQFTKALRMLDSFQVLEAESDPSWASSTRGALFSNRALVNLRLEQWQASEEDCTESLKFNPQGVKAFYRRAMAREKLNRVDDALKDTEEALRLQPNAEELLALQRRLQALKPKVETPRGFKRMEIVEASEEEEEEEEVVAEAKPNEAAIEAPAEPFADIELEHTVAGAEKAKDMGNKLFQEGKIQECERWFSKAIWLVEESGKVSAPDTLRGILHSNRAFARLRMQRWSSAELDCDEALQLNGKNPKALYRRAMARKELLKKLQGALHDINELLPMLEQKKDALKLKEELEAEIASTHPAMNGEVQKASEASEVPPAAEVPPALEVPPEALRPTSAPPCPPAPQTAVPAEKPVEASRPSSAPRASREARTLASAPSLPSNIPKNSMEMLRQFKSLKKHPEVLTKYVTEKVSPALLQSLFCRSPIEADDLALVLQSLRTAANDTDRPLTGERIGEYLQQLLRTHAAETQFSMLSSAEKELLRNLATMAPNGDELKKSFAKVL